MSFSGPYSVKLGGEPTCRAVSSQVQDFCTCLLYFLGIPVGPFLQHPKVSLNGSWALQHPVTSVHAVFLVSIHLLWWAEYRHTDLSSGQSSLHMCIFRTLSLNASGRVKLGLLAAHTWMEKPLEPEPWWQVNSATNSLILTFSWMSIPSQHTLPEHHKLYMCSFSWFSFPVLVASLLVPSSPEEITVKENCNLKTTNLNTEVHQQA